MSLSDLVTGFNVGGTTSTEGKQTKEQKPKAKFWINVGPKRGTGDAAKLVSLPMGIPLDGLKPRDIPSSSTKNQDFRNLRIAEKKLFEQLMQLCSKLQPGQSVCLSEFVVELRRCEEAETAEEQVVENNPYDVGELKVG